jgi:hypothetical protein
MSAVLDGGPDSRSRGDASLLLGFVWVTAGARVERTFVLYIELYSQSKDPHRIILRIPSCTNLIDLIQ